MTCLQYYILNIMTTYIYIELFTSWYYQSYRFLSLHQIFVPLYLLVSEIANNIA